MIVLDTNVVSEAVRPRPDPAVIAWLDEQDSDELMITTLTAAELRTGLALMPPGRRRRDLDQRIEALIGETFDGNVLAFDLDCSPHYADIVAVRTRAGRPITAVDALIAAVCIRHGAALATRNTADFDGVGLELINPWAS